MPLVPRWKSSLPLLLALAASLLACQNTDSSEKASAGVGGGLVAAQGETARFGQALGGAEPVPSAVLPGGKRAAVGEPAPAFELPDLDGKTVRLTDFAGKTVVLEWFNPECPFVRAAHTKGSLVDVASRLQKQGVVYLAINSAAPGKQGSGVDVNRMGVEKFRLTHPVLLDESGAVGNRFGATNTPHLYVINPAGTLVYQGAVDNSPDGEGESPQGSDLVSYLEQAVSAVLAGQPVKVPETKAYGCSVKYASR